MTKIVKQMIELNKIQDLKCEKCFKYLEFDLLKQLIPESLYLEYIHILTNLEYKTEGYF